MPHHERHKTQRSKNWLLMSILLLFIAVIYALTLVKLGA
jgi:cbb3-type cytochrome oxidase subunit 3